MKSKRIVVVIFIVSVLVLGILFWIQKSQIKQIEKLENLEQSSLVEKGGSEIQMPPENRFHKKKLLQRDVQSEKNELRNPINKDRKPNGGAKINFQDIKLESHEILDGTSWKIWTNVKAQPKSEPTTAEIFEINKFSIVPSELNQVRLAQFDPTQPAVVYDSRRKTVGLVSGTLIATLQKGVNPQNLTEISDVKVLQSFPEIETYFVTSMVTPFNLVYFKQMLSQVNGVKKVETEILSRKYGKY